MRFGFCTGFATGFAEHIDFEMLRDIKWAGYDYAELPLMQIAAVEEAEFEKLSRTFEELALGCDASCNLFPGSVRVTGKNANPKKIGAYLDAAFERSEKLGIKKLVFGSSAARDLDSDTSPEDGWRQLTELCRAQLAPRLEKHGMTMVIEPIARAEANFINTLEEGMRLTKLADHPRVTLLADTIHLLRNGETAEELRKYLPAIDHIHVSELERALPAEEYSKELGKMLDALCAFGYDKTVSFETGPYDDRETIACALRTLKRRLGYAD